MASGSGNHNLLFKAIVLALCVISFVHVFLFPLYGLGTGGGGGSARTALRTFQDFEQSLCTANLRRRRPAKRSAACPQYGIVTIVQGGRLGNQMWEYASVWALARRTGLEPYVPRCIRLKLDQLFESLSVPSFDEISHCHVHLQRFVKSPDAWNSTNQSIILPRYSTQPELVLNWVQDIIAEFSIRKRLLERSQQILTAIKKSVAASKASSATTSPDNALLFVGVHVRRTDYIGYLKRKHGADPADLSFYLRAMLHFEQKYSTVVFVVVSDDPLWCRRHLGSRPNVHVTGGNRKKGAPANSAALDLALLASCNHSIFDYGTFGEWGALLAGGETVYYNLSRHSSGRLGRLLHNWHTI